MSGTPDVPIIVSTRVRILRTPLRVEQAKRFTRHTEYSLSPMTRRVKERYRRVGDISLVTFRVCHKQHDKAGERWPRQRFGEHVGDVELSGDMHNLDAPRGDVVAHFKQAHIEVTCADFVGVWIVNTELRAQVVDHNSSRRVKSASDPVVIPWSASGLGMLCQSLCGEVFS